MIQRIVIAIIFSLTEFIPADAQVVDAPKLSCVTNVSIGGNIYVRLVWTLPSNSCGGTFNAYNIFRADNLNGPYALIYSETSQFASSYDDDISGNGPYYYYMVSDFTCPGGTYLHSDTLDNLDPATPVINYVTVNNNTAIINWQPGTSPETFGYIIYKLTPSNFPFDTIYGINNTTYTDINAAVNTDSVSYTLASIDSCLNTGIINEFPQHTIFLNKTIDRCTQKITLNWYAYNNWQPGVQQYDIYVSTNGGASVLIQSVPSNVLFYNLENFSDGDSLCVTIVATQQSTGITSTSNTVCMKFNVVEPAKDLFIRNVTVSAPNEADVYYSMDPLADLLSLRIERSLDSILFSPLATLSLPADLSIINIYPDTTALTSQLSYYYRIIATDSCHRSDTSTIGKSILLTGYAFSDLSFLIRWDESFFDYGTVTAYDLYRNDGNGFSLVTNFTPSIYEYGEENLSTTTPCYYVEGVDSLNFPNGISDTVHSRSNVLCLNQPSQIYMPNAFAPQGKNNIFKPILNIEGITSYTFSIFNRWGKQLFLSSDPDEGWDGRFNGTVVQQGAYAYQVIIVDENRKQIVSKGTVLVVR